MQEVMPRGGERPGLVHRLTYSYPARWVFVVGVIGIALIILATRGALGLSGHPATPMRNF